MKDIGYKTALVLADVQGCDVLQKGRPSCGGCWAGLIFCSSLANARGRNKPRLWRQASASGEREGLLVRPAGSGGGRLGFGRQPSWPTQVFPPFPRTSTTCGLRITRMNFHPHCNIRASPASFEVSTFSKSDIRRGNITR